jgi:hypothetical protein
MNAVSIVVVVRVYSFHFGTTSLERITGMFPR